MSKTRTDYDKDLINREVVAVCDHYLTSRRGEGKRQTYKCPVCGDRNFEVDPVMGYAGCFDAACEAPTTTDALGIIAYFEGNPLSGEGFVLCLKKGYEILGLGDPEERGQDQPGPESSNNSNGRVKAMSPRDNARNKRAITPRTAPEDQHSTEGTEERAGGGANGEYAGPKWGAAATADPASDGGHATGLEQPIQAWQENTDGSRSAIAAVVIHEEESSSMSGSTENVEDAELAIPREPDTEAAPGPQVADERQKAHDIFEVLLRLCRLEERDERFLEGRGLDAAAIEEGRFGSMSKDRCDYVLTKLDQRFSREELLSAPGFYETKSCALRFSLYGDYVLIPYLDNEGYIRTVEGRFTGEEMGEYDKRYKALLGSAVHLYVHPRYKPGEVVAVCEGAVGAMVAARYGFAVAAIKGFRNYRARGEKDPAAYTVLPELSGVDFAGKVVVYIPDLDVKPKSYAEVMKAVPAACHWMIERQGGIPKVAILPKGAEDLDAWILSLGEEEREQKIGELLDGAMPVERFEQEYLNTEDGKEQAGLASWVGDGSDEDGGGDASQQKDGASGREDSGSTEPELEEVGGWEDSGGSDPGQRDSNTTGEDASQSQDNGSSECTGNTDSSLRTSAVHDTREDTRDGNGFSSREPQQVGPENTESEDSDETNELKSTEETTSELEASQSDNRGGEDETEELELEPALELEQHDFLPSPAYHVGVKGERYLYVVTYVVAAILLSFVAWLATGGWLSWAWSLVLGAGLAIWTTAGFRKLYRWRERRRLQGHIEGN